VVRVGANEVDDGDKHDMKPYDDEGADRDVGHNGESDGVNSLATVKDAEEK
jgi:hypothetical protein